MKFYFKNPAAVAAFVQTAVALVAVYVKDLPTETLTAFILAALGIGIHAQKVENSKTTAALFTDPVE